MQARREHVYSTRKGPSQLAGPSCCVMTVLPWPFEEGDLSAEDMHANRKGTVRHNAGIASIKTKKPT